MKKKPLFVFSKLPFHIKLAFLKYFPFLIFDVESIFFCTFGTFFNYII